MKTAAHSPLLPDRTGQAPCPCWSAQTHWPVPWSWPCPWAGRRWGSCHAGPPSPAAGRSAWVCAAPGEGWWASGSLSSTPSLASLLLNLVCGVCGSVKKHLYIHVLSANESLLTLKQIVNIIVLFNFDSISMLAKCIHRWMYSVFYHNTTVSTTTKITQKKGMHVLSNTDNLLSSINKTKSLT